MQIRKPYLIAEISANHNGSINTAKKLIKLAKNNGADAVKAQTYTPDTMTPKSDLKHFKIKKDYGKVIIYGIYIIKVTLHIHGIKNFLILQKKQISQYLVHLLMRLQ